MTTDAGIDLVAYAPARMTGITIQVKTHLKPKPAGGRGKQLPDWWLGATHRRNYLTSWTFQRESVCSEGPTIDNYVSE